MAVQIVKPVDTELPMNSLTVEKEAENEDQFEWISLLCCSYGSYFTGIDIDWDEDTDM